MLSDLTFPLARRSSDLILFPWWYPSPYTPSHISQGCPTLNPHWGLISQEPWQLSRAAMFRRVTGIAVLSTLAYHLLEMPGLPPTCPLLHPPTPCSEEWSPFQRSMSSSRWWKDHVIPFPSQFPQSQGEYHCLFPFTDNISKCPISSPYLNFNLMSLGKYMLRSWEREDQVSPECDPLRGGPGCGLVHGRSCSPRGPRPPPSELAGQWAQGSSGGDGVNIWLSLDLPSLCSVP